jgi:anti-sigma factor (TIGR02949 family)
MSRRLDRSTCEEAFRRLDDYLDRRLTAGETRLIEDHLHVCEACSREFTFEAGIIRGVREKLRRVAAPADLIARIAAQIALEAGPASP